MNDWLPTWLEIECHGCGRLELVPANDGGSKRGDASIRVQFVRMW